MMRAIRDNRDAAEAMGKDVTRRHLQIFVLGSAVVGIGGAMLVTLDGQFTPGSYNPLRYTFLIWVMVIVGGSGNNWGAVLGGFLIWYVWVMAEPFGTWIMSTLTAGMAPGSFWQQHLLAAAPHIRFLLMGLILLLVAALRPPGPHPRAQRAPPLGSVGADAARAARRRLRASASVRHRAEDLDAMPAGRRHDPFDVGLGRGRQGIAGSRFAQLAHELGEVAVAGHHQETRRAGLR